MPAGDWLDSYYTPLATRVVALRRKYVDDADATGVLDSIDREIELYRRYGNEYGYFFYILQRR